MLTVFCLVLCASMTFAAEPIAGLDKASAAPQPAEQEWSWRFKPTFSVGYAFGGDTHIRFTRASSTSVLGASKIDLKTPDFSGIYLAGELPFALTDRLKLTLGGRWASTGSAEDRKEVYNNGIANRYWDSDDSYWVTADLLLSYAFVKDVCFIKDISAVAGFRWDHQKMEFESPHTPIGVLNSPLDAIDFRMNTYSPVLGLTSTFKGFKSGIFGGDMKLGVSGSPVGWGDITYREEFGQASKIHCDSKLNRSQFFNVLGEITALSGMITPCAEASLSLFAQYTKFFAKDRPSLKGGLIGGPTIVRAPFDFRMNPNLAVVGVKAAIAF
jgi:hypothetical protein